MGSTSNFGSSQSQKLAVSLAGELPKTIPVEAKAKFEANIQRALSTDGTFKLVGYTSAAEMNGLDYRAGYVCPNGGYTLQSGDSNRAALSASIPFGMDLVDHDPIAPASARAPLFPKHTK